MKSTLRKSDFLRYYHMIIIPTFQARHLAPKIRAANPASSTTELLHPGFNRDGKRFFPDGEVYAKIEEAETLRNKKVMVLHSGAPRANSGLIELELILQILKDSAAHPIEVFFTYFPYGMQDRVFEKGETNVAENLVEKLMDYYRVKKIYIVDAHFAGRQWIKKYPITLLSALPLLKKQAETDLGSDIVYISADKGGKRRTGIKGVSKKRENSHTTTIEGMEKLKGIVKNRTVAIVDDLIETGGTLSKLYGECKRNGAREVTTLITHGVLNSGIKRIAKTYPKIYLTNTINRKEANIDITNLILDTCLSHPSASEPRRRGLGKK